ncbi:amidohydrolase family protein [Frankia sp. Cr2]|uniref:amidohydrolase family protein n=1 Tax=Frankia sp. Cr2 TaxID=3073932 RepID=UPI002AD484B8|nr:amidohydrolase family protein [Frankia sp. Cr2]
MTPVVDYPLFDADSHLYEPRDAFTDYIDPAFRAEALRPVRDAAGTELIVAGDRIVTFTDGNLYEQVHVPGTLAEKLRAMKSGIADDERFYQPPRPEYLQPQARLADLDRQGVEAAIVFPGLALFAESFCRRTDVLYANLNAFNRWLFETWGFANAGRLFCPPAISFRDLDEAVRQTEWVLERGARVVMLRTGPAYGRSPGDRYFDPVWARLNEAGVGVAYHITDSGYNEREAVHWGQDANPRPYDQSAWQWMNLYGDRAIMDTLSALVYDNLFGRFPQLKVISVEHGASWLPYFMGRIDKMRGMGRNGPWIGGPLPSRPTEIVRAHILVVPYPEDDIAEIAGAVGSDCLVMGSDYPHGEGMADPSQMPKLVDFLPEKEQRAVCRDRGMAFVGRAAAG